MHYQATLRRVEVTAPALLAILTLFLLGLYGATLQREIGQMMTYLVCDLVLTLFAMAFALANCFRKHGWTIEPDGLRIAERPYVPFTGIGRSAFVPFAQIAGFNRLKSGMFTVVDLHARDGRTFRMAQVMKSGPGGFGDPGESGSLDAFVTAICDAAGAAGVQLPETGEALGFWSSVAGILFLLLLLVIAIGFAALVAWAILEGETRAGARMGWGVGVALMLPFGAGLLLLKAVRRRRFVLGRNR